jgi:transposase-like protein
MVEAIVWAMENREELSPLAQSSETWQEAIVTLTRAPYSFSESAARAALNLSFGGLNKRAVARILEARERMRRGEDFPGLDRS